MRNIFYLLLLACSTLYSCKTNDEERIKHIPPPSFPPNLCTSPDYVGKMKVAVIVYNGVEVVDMNGPIDVFTKANYVHNHYYIYTVAATPEMVYTENGTTCVKPCYSFATAPSPDIVVLPGCNNVSAMLEDTTFRTSILPWVTKMGSNPEKDVMGVCTGAILLAETGLLANKKATTHYLALEILRTRNPTIDVKENVRFVDTLNFVTTAGITSGIDGALHLVEKYDGKVVADSAAHIMVYNRNCPMREPAN
jgi:transcriptional regulator GlxA family with amidase domain